MVRLNRTYYSLLKSTSKIVWYGLTVHIIRFKKKKLHILFQTPAPAENPVKFQQITQILRDSPTQSANYAKFTPFANTTPYVSDA